LKVLDYFYNNINIKESNLKKTVFLSLALFVFIFLADCGIKLVPRYPEGRSLEENPPFTENRPARNVTNATVMNKVLYQKFLTEIKKFLGAPYLWGGASPAGTDCSGLISTLYKRAANVDLPHSTTQLSQMGSNVHIKQIKFGDLVFFNNGQGKKPMHIGFYLVKGSFLHASETRGVIVSNLTDVPFKSQYLGAKRILE